ncbi:MAG TPA: flavodoxin domain-containing protein [Candidatus Limnocylindria bacterium]|nr:flavodoxin domain-containing protein [Candidatus Limnocylindria bacterium]
MGRAIAETLVAEGLLAELHPVEVLGALGEFDVAVIGSGVYVGRWLEPARRFVERHAEQLAAMPVWLFSSGPLGEKDPQPAGDPTDVAALVNQVRPRAHRVFPGALRREGLGLMERGVVRMVGAPYGDFRDTGAIHAWAHEIAAELRQPVGAVPGRR